MAVGGDITELTYNHPDLGSGVIYPKAGEDNTIDLGGFRSNDADDAIDGSGVMIDQINQKRWSVSCTVAWDMNVAQTNEKLVALAASPKPADWTVTLINGIVYGGKGKPVGDLSGNGNVATMPLKLAGGNGGLKQI